MYGNVGRGLLDSLDEKIILKKNWSINTKPYIHEITKEFTSLLINKSIVILLISKIFSKAKSRKN